MLVHTASTTKLQNMCTYIRLCIPLSWTPQLTPCLAHIVSAELAERLLQCFVCKARTAGKYTNLHTRSVYNATCNA